MAELVDAHDSGSCARKGVEVRVFSSAFSSTSNTNGFTLCRWFYTVIPMVLLGIGGYIQ